MVKGFLKNRLLPVFMSAALVLPLMPGAALQQAFATELGAHAPNEDIQQENSQQENAWEPAGAEGDAADGAAQAEAQAQAADASQEWDPALDELVEAYTDDLDDDGEDFEAVEFDEEQAMLTAQALNPVLLDDIRMVYTIAGSDPVKLVPQDVKGTPYFFAPSGVDFSRVAIEYDATAEETVEAISATDPAIAIVLSSGVDFDLASIMGAPANDEWRFVLQTTANGEVEQRIEFAVMQSDLPSIFVTSADPESKGRPYIDGSPDHSTQAPGSIRMFDPAADEQYSGAISAIKGRGNASWKFTSKKSYQVKLKSKTSLIDPADSSQSSKKWLLIANAYDPTMVRNALVHKMSKAMGLDAYIDCEHVDFFYDGEYRGTYLLCEKVEIGKGRVDIHDLESDIEKANPDVTDFDALTTYKSTTAYGGEMQYVGGVKSPSNITGGYLLELDNGYWAEEKSWFRARSGDYFVSKSPEYLSRDQVLYISSFVEEIYDCIDNGGIHPRTGKRLFDYIDKDSFTKYYYVQQFVKNPDAFVSSTFFYKPANEDKLYAGPLWDFDTSLGIRVNGGNLDYGYTGMWTYSLCGRLLGVDDFRGALASTYCSGVRDIALASINGGAGVDYAVDSLVAKVAKSAAMNYRVWPFNDLGGAVSLKPTLAENNAHLKSWMKKRFDWLDAEIGTYSTSIAYNGVDYSGVYDAEFYISRNPDVLAVFGKGNYKAYLQHFIDYGMSEGRPAIEKTKFDLVSYYNLHQDLRIAFGRDLKSYYMHYVNYGQREGRACTGQNAVKHYINYQGRASYGAIYDGAVYRSSHVDLNNAFRFATNYVVLFDDQALLAHFLKHGMDEGRKSSENFDLTSYYNAHSDLRAAFGRNLRSYYTHYLNYGIRENRICKGVPTLRGAAASYGGVWYGSIYSADVYRDSNPDLKGTYSFNTNYVRLYDDVAMISHFVSYGMSQGRKASDSFDVVSYYNANPDLRRAFGLDLKSYYMHYINYGQREGRVCTGVAALRGYVYEAGGVNYYPVYNGATYRAAHWDLENAFTCNVGQVSLFDDAALLNHFVKYGMKEGRKASSNFDVNVYRSRYWDLDAAFGNDLARYYIHYLEYGVREGRSAS